MATDNDPFQPPSSESREAGYETSGISIKGLAIFLVCLVALAAAIDAGVWFLFGGYVKLEESTNRPHSALTDEQYVTNYNREHGTDFAPAGPVLPPEPRIQPTPGLAHQNNPPADLQEMYDREDAIFRRMGWAVNDHTHRQVAMPESVLRSVISDESARQKQNPRPAGSPAEGNK
jgi:hypothetical protein